MPYREAGDQILKILFADDSATMRKVAEITFASDGYDLMTLDNSSALVEQVKKNQPSVVILDTDMPGVSGYDACKQLRADGAIAQVPVLLLSGPSSPYDERRGKEAGATDHIDKPFETQSLYDKVKGLASAPPKPAEPAKPAESSKPAARPKVGSKTVLGLGAMGAAPKPGGPAPSPAIEPSGLGQKPKQAPPAKPAATQPGPIASPVAAKPKQAPPAKPAAKPGIPKPEMPQPDLSKKPAASPAPQKKAAKPAAGLESLSNLTNESKSAEQRASEMTPEQIEAIKVVAKEVIERVVWEVVPDLAETIIKEELAKLLKE